MWCSTCQQEMPGVAHGVSRRIVCARCQHALEGAPGSTHTRISDQGIALDDVPASVVASAPPFHSDQWASRRRMRELERELKRTDVAAMADPAPRDARRFDPPQNLFDDGAVLAVADAPQAPAVSASVVRRSEGGQFAAWLCVATGAVALGGGLGAMAWTLAAPRMDYWNLALGLVLGGQGTLILGLVLVVMRLWRNSRYATGKLQDVHTRLAQLQQTAETLGAMRGGGAPAFYADLARGASPHLLAANLKGQLDQLSRRLGTRA